MNKKIIIKDGFRLPSGQTNYPRFTKDGKYLAIKNTNKIEVWDVNSKKKIAAIKSKGMINPWGIAISGNGKRVAFRNERGFIDVMDVGSGSLVRRIIRKPDGSDHILLTYDGSEVIEASSGDQEGLFIWNVDTGNLVEEFRCTYRYMPSALSISLEGNVACLFMARYDENKPRDFIYLKTATNTKKIFLETSDSSAAISPDGKKIFVAGLLNKDIARLSLMDLDGNSISTRDVENLKTFPLNLPQWSPDARLIAWPLSLLEYEYHLLDGNSLEHIENIYWPGISMAFGQNDYVAITGKHGFICKLNQLTDLVQDFGLPTIVEMKKKSDALSLRVTLRKNCVPKVAVFLWDNTIRVEAEILVGYFRYLSSTATNLLSPSDDDLGSEIMKALAAFSEVNEFSRIPLPWRAYYEHEQLKEIGVPENRITDVRYLGHMREFTNPNVPTNARYISITSFNNKLDVWPSKTIGNGNFCDIDWPHLDVDISIDNAELGRLVFDSFKLCEIE